MRPELDFRLLNEFQRDFPLEDRPYAAIGRRIGASEVDVLEALRRFLDSGAISRIGAVFAPGWLGASTLAAMAVPRESIEAVAASVSRHPEVNHNYEREHALNLWFVATAQSQACLSGVLGQIEQDTGLEVLSLPLLEEFHIDLGFDLANGSRAADVGPRITPRTRPATAQERRLAGALQDGLTLTARPYAALAQRCDLAQATVIDSLHRWQCAGLVRRFGVIVRHRDLGFAANAMVAWDVADTEVGDLGRRLASLPGINLCYRRARHPPRWSRNLYCMIHARTREEVARRVAGIRAELRIDGYDHDVLISRRCFKQTGARYVPQAPVRHG